MAKTGGRAYIVSTSGAYRLSSDSDLPRDGPVCMRHFTGSCLVGHCVTLHKGLPVLRALLTLVSELQRCVTLNLYPWRCLRASQQ